MMKKELEAIQAHIEKAAQKSGRTGEDIQLIAVSKTYPVSAIEEARALGLTAFGENKVQELTQKIETLGEQVEWHLIGHLQTNKVKYIIGKVALIHSVDSLKLAKEIAKQSVNKGVTTSILVQVNLAKEDTKSGFYEEELMAVIKELSGLKGIKVEGLMMIAPFVANPEENRPLFSKLFNISVDIEKQNIDNISTKILSMGMSNDYRVAIEEGANMVRVGTALFGQRVYA